MIGGILWRRLDVPGHDACRLLRSDAGWQLEGAAAFRHERNPRAPGLSRRLRRGVAYVGGQGLRLDRIASGRAHRAPDR